MSTMTAVPTATLPRVNLLPQEIVQAGRFRTAQLGMLAVLLAAAGVVLGMYYMAAGDASTASDALTVAQAQTVRLPAQQATYAKVPLCTRRLRRHRPS